MNNDHDLRDPKIEWDQVRNRNMCRFIVIYAAACLAVGLFIHWLRT